MAAADGELRRADVAAHLVSCAACARAVTRAAFLAADIAEALARLPRAHAFTCPKLRRRPRAALGAAVAAVCGCVGLVAAGARLQGPAPGLAASPEVEALADEEGPSQRDTAGGGRSAGAELAGAAPGTHVPRRSAWEDPPLPSFVPAARPDEPSRWPSRPAALRGGLMPASFTGESELRLLPVSLGAGGWTRCMDAAFGR